VRPDFLDRHARLASPIHRLPTAVKAGAALLLLIALALVPPRQPWLFALVALLFVAVVGASRIPPRFLLGRLLLLEPLALGVAALAFLQPGGWRHFLLLVGRSTLALGVVLLLSQTTPFAALLRLLRRLRLPALLVTLLALMYRYLFVLADEAERLQRARASRTFSRRRGRDWRAIAAVAGRLFGRASERSERIYGAMCARGWRP